MLFKSVLRTVRRSLGRYLAILSIIALGVGFFAGLRVTQKAMIRTADRYLQELALYDFRLLSTLGLTDEDVLSFGTLPGVEGAYGSVSADLIFRAPNGSDSVLHAHTLLDGVNGVDLWEGRMPERADECLLDAKAADGIAVGDIIRLSDSNDEQTRDYFSYEAYTVVGIVNAAAYINFERGSTALSGGSVRGFMYVLPEGFCADVYTEIYLKLADWQTIYSDAYEAALAGIRPAVEARMEERAGARYVSIYAEAEGKIADAQAELEDKAAALAEARRQTEEGYQEYREKRTAAEKELSDIKATLDKARAELDEAWNKLEAAKADPSAVLEQVAAVLEATEIQLRKQEAVYAENVRAYEQALAEANEQFARTERELADAVVKTDEAQVEIDRAQADIDKAREELSNIQRPVTYVLDRSANIGYASLENDTAIVSGVARVFPLFFFLVAALVCITTMTRMVSEQRVQNGILKALGYGEAAISGQYLFYAGSASVAGCVIGFLLGSKWMPVALWQVYGIMYDIDRPVEFVLDYGLFAMCSILYLVCALGATWFVCSRDLHESAAQLVRPKAPKAGKRILLERVTFLWKHVKFLHKVSIRNILRYKKRMVMMLFGIGGCTALLLTGFGIRDTIRPVADYQYNEIELYDAAVSFTRPADDVAREKFKQETGAVAENIAFLHTGEAGVLWKGQRYDMNLSLIGEDLSDFVDLHAGEKKVAFPGVGEAVINYRFAQENGVSVGDTLTVITEDDVSLTVKVSGIFDNYVYDRIYLSEETYKEQAGTLPTCNTAYVNFRSGQDEKEAGAGLLGADNVANVMLTRDMEERVGSMMKSLDYIVLIVLVCAGALAFIVLYNLTNITITERTREIATLKVLGFYPNEQHQYVFRENLILTAISALCGLPMGMALLRYVMAQIKISTLYFGCRLAPLSYVWAVLITFFFTIIVDLALTSKTARIDMAQAMKTVE